ncbi:MAG: GNAT family N-acetyltransferase [Burkholderiales bacterium]|jgi:GNAT superfamily N-acetyltransferase
MPDRARITVRRLVSDDAPAYRALMLDAYREHPDAFTSSAEERAAQPTDWWAWRLAPGDAVAQRVFGAFDAGGLVGAAGWSRGERAKVGHRAELFGMAVVAAARGRGAGRALVGAVIADARAAGALTMALTVTDGNGAAERLYARCGFVRIGLEPMAVRVGETFVAKATLWRRLDEGDPESGRGGPGITGR